MTESRTNLSSYDTFNLNVSPYFDDHGEGLSMRYTKVLFKPGKAVQARELNQIQTYNALGLKSICDFILNEGSEMYPCLGNNGTYEVYANSTFQYVKLHTDTNTELFEAGDIIHNSSNSTQMNVYIIVSSDGTNPPTIVGKYEDGSGIFTAAEEVYINSEALPTSNVSDESTPTGNSSVVTIENSYWYVRGRPLLLIADIKCIDRYSTDVTKRIGIEVVEKIVTADDDETLLDNATGTYNYNAPGGDRYSKYIKLEIKDRTSGDTGNVITNDPETPNFFEFARVVDGVITDNRDSPDLSDVFNIVTEVQDLDFNNHTLQLKEKTNAELTAETGSDREIIINEDNHTIHIMDGLTAGGYPCRSDYLSSNEGASGEGYFNGNYYLDWDNFINIPNWIASATNDPFTDYTPMTKGYFSTFLRAYEREHTKPTQLISTNINNIFGMGFGIQDTQVAEQIIQRTVLEKPSLSGAEQFKSKVNSTPVFLWIPPAIFSDYNDIKLQVIFFTQNDINPASTDVNFCFYARALDWEKNYLTNFQLSPYKCFGDINTNYISYARTQISETAEHSSIHKSSIVTTNIHCGEYGETPTNSYTIGQPILISVQRSYNDNQVPSNPDTLNGNITLWGIRVFYQADLANENNYISS